MTYDNVSPGIFLTRPNRFVAHCLVDGREVRCHVKNTGRCRELLVPGARVYLQRAGKEGRSTEFDLIAVEKGERLINMDSQAPNRVFRDWAEGGGVEGLEGIKGECVFGDSRLDFRMETGDGPVYVEVKGVTLEEDGVVLFPDAPTERGVKHLRALCGCVAQGFGAMVVFVVQMQGVAYFMPNEETHPAFGQALREAAKAGVRVMALDCVVTPGSIVAKDFVEIRL